MTIYADEIMQGSLVVLAVLITSLLLQRQSFQRRRHTRFTLLQLFDLARERSIVYVFATWPFRFLVAGLWLVTVGSLLLFEAEEIGFGIQMVDVTGIGLILIGLRVLADLLALFSKQRRY